MGGAAQRQHVSTVSSYFTYTLLHSFLKYLIHCPYKTCNVQSDAQIRSLASVWLTVQFRFIFHTKIQNNSASQKTWKLHRFQLSWDTDPKQVCYSLNNIQQVEALINWVMSLACRVRKCVLSVCTCLCIFVSFSSCRLQLWEITTTAVSINHIWLSRWYIREEVQIRIIKVFQ